MRIGFLCLAWVALLQTACVGSGDPSIDVDGWGETRLLLAESSAADAVAVNVHVDTVEVHLVPSGHPDQKPNWQVVRDEDLSVNLMELRDGVTAVLGEAVFPVGKITQIRLHLCRDCESTLVDATGTHPLIVPSGPATGIKLVGCFVVADQGETEITLDFSVADSVHRTGNGRYQMRPTIRIKEAGDCDPTGPAPVQCYGDNDGDGYGSFADPIVPDDGACDDPGESIWGTDCNDFDSTISPGATDIPGNWIDEDCNGVDAALCYVDSDGDGFGHPTDTLVAPSGNCADVGGVANNQDCNDGDAAINPEAWDEPGNGLDENCDGSDG